MPDLLKLKLKQSQRFAFTFVSGAISLAVRHGCGLAVAVGLLLPAVLSQSLHEVAVHERRPSLPRHIIQPRHSTVTTLASKLQQLYAVTKWRGTNPLDPLDPFLQMKPDAVSVSGSPPAAT